MSQKQQHGIYYTAYNPFMQNRVFMQWVQEHDLKHVPVLEPFAGSNAIIHQLHAVGLAQFSASFDLEPADPLVLQQDTMQNFPKNFNLCITNPPWMAKVPCKRYGRTFPSYVKYDDVYKHCLELALKYCDYVAMLLPASFLQTGLFQERLQYLQILNKPLFKDTTHPVCLAMFDKYCHTDFTIYDGYDRLGMHRILRTWIPPQLSGNKLIRFNDPQGELGFIAFDNTREASIRFCYGKELAGRSIKQSSRQYTRIGVDLDGSRWSLAQLIDRANEYIAEMREKTADCYLTPFKGLRKDGKYRRKMNFQTARGIVFSSLTRD